MIAHIQTTLQTIFVTLDEKGDVVKRHPFSAELANLSDEAFLEVAKKLRELKEQLQ